MTSTLVAQNTAAYESTLQKFQEHFNAQETDAIFELYSTQAQEEMTKEGITQFVKGCYGQFGNLKEFIFIEEVENVYSYSILFEKGTLLMDIQLAPDGKITTIQLQEP
ncbi:hypothetical protein GCM10022393_32610 [Aquimarina addita]|uniref:DUF3887 domain-containing protein n=2 Tax=Aquimarina addita TaxID=870485 RepID=A0ABP6UT51_9FLAO